MIRLEIRILTAAVFTALTLSLLSFAPKTSATSDCKNVHGVIRITNNLDGTTSGVISKSGRLDGSTQSTFTSGFTPTPEPLTYSFTDDLSATTSEGILVTHNVGIFDTANGLFTAINRIDPNLSTGEFAAATGVLYINGKTADGVTFQATLTGTVCSSY